MNSKKIKIIGNRTFILLPELKYAVHGDGKNAAVIYPAGTKNVWCSFRTSHISYENPQTGRFEKLNVYMKNNVFVHGR